VIHPSRTNATISASLSSLTTLSCLLLHSLAAPPKSVHDVIISGQTNSVISSSPILSFSHLIPDTPYTLYCVTKNLNDVLTPHHEMLASTNSFQTNCCKRIEVILKQQYFFTGGGSSSVGVDTTNSYVVINIDVAASESSDGDVRLFGQLKGESPLPIMSSGGEVDLFYPNHISWDPSNKRSSITASLLLMTSTLMPGDYEILVTYNVTTSSSTPSPSYEVVFPLSRNFSILSSEMEPPVVPKVIESSFIQTRIPMLLDP
jgi:hypothetical protein